MEGTALKAGSFGPEPRERIARAIASLVFRFPAPILRLLAGGGRVRRDGQELAADVQLALRLGELGGHRSLDTMAPPAARAEIRRVARLAAAGAPAVARVRPLTIPGPGGPVAARLWVPREDGRLRGLVVYYHGGGWVVGDLDTHDGVCRFLACEADVGVLAPECRLAPEHRFPAAVEDALAAFRWAAAEAAALGFDPARVAVAGDSAGGNLAAVVSQLSVRQGGPRPALQLLIYPVTDLSTRHPSYDLFADGFFLTAGEMAWYRGHYLPDDAAARDPRASPLLASDLAGLPPAIVLTAGFDVLRDEGEAYARRLEAAGVEVELRRHVGLVHGFANATTVLPSARAAMAEAARMVALRTRSTAAP
jgi:acetyl esterase